MNSDIIIFIAIIVAFVLYVCLNLKHSIQTETFLPTKQGICQNKSLNDMRLQAYAPLIEHKVPPTKFPICSDSYVDPLNESEIDPYKHYRKYQQYVKAFLNDPVLKSGNIEEYYNSADISQIGNILLDNKNKEDPKPNGYIFSDSPANISN